MAMGLCLGGLASAAVCTSRTSIELIPRAVLAVTVAFRIGAKGSEMAARLVPRTAIDELEGKWSILVSGATASDALDKYCERTVSTQLISGFNQFAGVVYDADTIYSGPANAH